MDKWAVQPVSITVLHNSSISMTFAVCDLYQYHSTNAICYYTIAHLTIMSSNPSLSDALMLWLNSVECSSNG